MNTSEAKDIAPGMRVRVNGHWHTIRQIQPNPLSKRGQRGFRQFDGYGVNEHGYNVPVTLFADTTYEVA